MNTKEKIDAIIFRCFDQGTYWGKLAYSENERPDQPDNPIDRTEAVDALIALVEAERIEARRSERVWALVNMRKVAKGQNVEAWLELAEVRLARLTAPRQEEDKKQ